MDLVSLLLRRSSEALDRLDFLLYSPGVQRRDAALVRILSETKADFLRQAPGYLRWRTAGPGMQGSTGAAWGQRAAKQETLRPPPSARLVEDQPQAQRRNPAVQCRDGQQSDRRASDADSDLSGSSSSDAAAAPSTLAWGEQLGRSRPATASDPSLHSTSDQQRRAAAAPIGQKGAGQRAKHGGSEAVDMRSLAAASAQAALLHTSALLLGNHTLDDNLLEDPGIVVLDE